MAHLSDDSTRPYLFSIQLFKCSMKHQRPTNYIHLPLCPAVSVLQMCTSRGKDFNVFLIILLLRVHVYWFRDKNNTCCFFYLTYPMPTKQKRTAMNWQGIFAAFLKGKMKKGANSFSSKYNVWFKLPFQSVVPCQLVNISNTVNDCVDVLPTMFCNFAIFSLWLCY